MATMKIYGPLIKFPEMCPCCGERHDLGKHTIDYIETWPSGSGTGRVTQRTYINNIPYCKSCISHARECNSYFRYLAILPIPLDLFLIGFFPNSVPQWLLLNFKSIYWLIFLIIISIALYLILGEVFLQRSIAMMKKNCTIASWAISLHPTETGLGSGIIMSNENYAREFVKINDPLSLSDINIKD